MYRDQGLLFAVSKTSGLRFTVLEATQRSSSQIWRHNGYASPSKQIRAPLRRLKTTPQRYVFETTRAPLRCSKTSTLLFAIEETRATLPWYRSYTRSSSPFEETRLMFDKLHQSTFCSPAYLPRSAPRDTPWHLPSFLLLLLFLISYLVPAILFAQKFVSPPTISHGGERLPKRQSMMQKSFSTKEKYFFFRFSIFWRRILSLACFLASSFFEYIHPGIIACLCKKTPRNNDATHKVRNQHINICVYYEIDE